jgi:hypothetical protein
MAAAIGLGCGAALAAIHAIGPLHLRWQGQLSFERLGHRSVGVRLSCRQRFQVDDVPESGGLHDGRVAGLTPLGMRPT